MKKKLYIYLIIYLVISGIVYVIQSKNSQNFGIELGTFMVVPIFSLLINIVFYTLLTILRYFKILKTDKVFVLSLKTSLIIILFLISIFLIGKYIESSNKEVVRNENPQNYIDKELITFINELNNHCPIIIDKTTVLENVETYNNIIQFNHKIIDRTVDDMDLEEFKSFMGPYLKNKVVTNPDFKKFKGRVVIFSYNYIDKNGVFVERFNVSPSDYN